MALRRSCGKLLKKRTRPINAFVTDITKPYFYRTASVEEVCTRGYI